MIIEAGGAHTLFKKTDGTLWAWGANWYAQLNPGDTLGRGISVQVGGDSNWAAVSAGRDRSAALKADGTLWLWGSNWNDEQGPPCSARADCQAQRCD